MWWGFFCACKFGQMNQIPIQTTVLAEMDPEVRDGTVKSNKIHVLADPTVTALYANFQKDLIRIVDIQIRGSRNSEESELLRGKCRESDRTVDCEFLLRYNWCLWDLNSITVNNRRTFTDRPHVRVHFLLHLQESDGRARANRETSRWEIRCDDRREFRILRSWSAVNHLS